MVKGGDPGHRLVGGSSDGDLSQFGDHRINQCCNTYVPSGRKPFQLRMGIAR